MFRKSFKSQFVPLISFPFFIFFSYLSVFRSVVLFVWLLWIIFKNEAFDFDMVKCWGILRPLTLKFYFFKDKSPAGKYPPSPPSPTTMMQSVDSSPGSCPGFTTFTNPNLEPRRDLVLSRAPVWSGLHGTRNRIHNTFLHTLYLVFFLLLFSSTCPNYST